MRKPRVWLLMAHRAGDNSQVLALGEALGWPFEVKRFVYNRYEVLVNWPFSSWLVGIDKSRSSTLSPPWPDLIITAGRRNEPIARWIRNQAGHRVRVVHLGRPWAKLEGWDLVVTTPQYRLPRVANVLHNETSLHRIVPERLTDARAKWEPRLTALARPYIAVLVGGDSGPYPFDAAAGTRLGREASALARELGGSLLVTTSARTRLATTEALFAAVDAPSHCYSWRPNDTENPYFGFLALADRIIASGDSVSMMTEACATGRPVYLFDTGEGRNSMRGHDGRSVSLRDVILRHGGEAQASRDFFAAIPPRFQNRVLDFLGTLVLFSPEDTASNLNDADPTHPSFPLEGHGSISLVPLFDDATDLE